MEIVAETTLWGEFISAMIVIVIIAGVMIGLAATFISEIVKYRSLMDFVFAILSTLGAVFAVLLMISGFYVGPSEQYKAIVSDYNEVYEQGYEIVGREGELSILRESEAE